ncbi:MAG: hypothetical protein KKF80_02975, partial [Candidatus Omnitrophica bacterium]|nr:hypothetical protein [Candidatus Omnitrophota bacterium]
DSRVLEKAGQFGYKTIFTSDDRIAVRADWDIKHFKDVLHKGYSFRERTRRAMLAVAKRVLGPKGYDWVRDRVLSHHDTKSPGHKQESPEVTRSPVIKSSEQKSS